MMYQLIERGVYNPSKNHVIGEFIELSEAMDYVREVANFVYPLDSYSIYLLSESGRTFLVGELHGEDDIISEFCIRKI